MCRQEASKQTGSVQRKSKHSYDLDVRANTFDPALLRLVVRLQGVR